jgi:hypothetical protein
VTAHTAAGGVGGGKPQPHMHASRPACCCQTHNAAACCHRLRKDPLDPIDGGTKVRILFKRLTDPEFVKREQEMKQRQVRPGCPPGAGMCPDVDGRALCYNITPMRARWGCCCLASCC